MNFIKKLFGLVALVTVVSGVIVLTPELMYSQQSIDVNDVSSEEVSRGVIKALYHGRELWAPVIPKTRSIQHILGATNEERVIEVDLTNQRLYAYEGDRKVYDFLISSGKWGRTPTGEFSVWYKVVSTRMKGGSKELHTYYDLPNVPYTMFFYNKDIPQSRGYGIHGAYWHNNFGHPMSHGCINMKPEEAAVLFQWASPALPEGKRATRVSEDNPGTKIIIYGKAPLG